MNLMQYYSQESLTTLLGASLAGLLFEVDAGTVVIRKVKTLAGDTVFAGNWMGDQVWVVPMDSTNATNERQAEELVARRFVQERMERRGYQQVTTYRPTRNVTPDGERIYVTDVAFREMDQEGVEAYYNAEH
jgi:hypothetical protein